MSLREAVTDGRLVTLTALRDHLAGAIDECESLRDLASLAGRLQSVLTEIDELTPAKPAGDAVDEITARRARRTGAAKNPARAKRSG